MTTKHSPLRELKRQADIVAAKLKAASRGEVQFKDGAQHRASVKVGVVMDDKVLTIEMAWDTIRATSEAGLSEFILKHMREQRDAVH
jgi:hypothetical protein